MSVESMAICLHHSQARGNAKLVLIGIANHDGDGGAWPTVATLARYLGTDSRTTVHRALRVLVELGEIQVSPQEGGTRDLPDWRRPNLYRITLRCPSTCDRSKNHRVGGTAGGTGGVPVAVPKPSLEPSLEPEREGGPVDWSMRAAAELITGQPSPSLDDSLGPRCARHRGVVEPPACAPCGEARRAALRADLDKRLTSNRERLDRVAEARRVRQQAIAQCGMCDMYGYRGAVVCHHRQETVDAAANGAAAARAALAAAKEARHDSVGRGAGGTGGGESPR